MTIADTVNRIQYLGNNVADTFSLGSGESAIVFYNDTDLVVYETVIATGVDTLYTLTTDYTVSGGNGASGSITLVAGPLPSTKKITIERSIPLVQADDYKEGESILASSIETSLDKLVVISQQNRDAGQRSIKFSSTLPTSLNGKIVAAPIDGNILAWSGTSGDIVNLSVSSIENASFDTIFSGLASGNLLEYNGNEFVNVTTLSADLTFSGNLVCDGTVLFNDVIDVTNVNAETSAGGSLRTSGGTACISWGAGGSANTTLGGNMSGASTYKLTNMVDPTSAQDYATKNYVDTAAPTAKAWANFNGTGTPAIRSGYNVASITDNGAGNYTVNFTTALSDANYAVVATCSPTVNQTVAMVTNITTAGFDVIVNNDPGGSGALTSVDPTIISVIVFGN